MDNRPGSTMLSALRAVWRGEAQSRSDVARMLQLSRPTASAVVRMLIDEGFLVEAGCGRSSGGKPPIRLSVKESAFGSVGIDIGYESTVRGVRLDAVGNILASAESPASSSYSDRKRAVIDVARMLDCKSADCVGIAVSGIVDPVKREIIRSAYFELAGTPLADEVEEALELPVFIDNRARMAARAEQFSGAARKISDFALISLGRGVGSALSFSGRLYCGSSGQAGEIRELLVPDYDGKGLTTLEDILSEKALAERDPAPERLAELCAPGLGQLVAVTDPSTLILSGRFSLMPDSFISRLQELLPDVEVRRAQFGRDSGACGSAVAAIEYAIFNPNNRRK